MLLHVSGRTRLKWTTSLALTESLSPVQGLWSSMSFRRPRGVDVIHAAAVAARKPRPQPARGFTERGGPGPAAARRTPYDIAKDSGRKGNEGGSEGSVEILLFQSWVGWVLV